MKADLYIQGNYLATVDIPGDSLLALLAKGMIPEAQQKTAELQQALAKLDRVECTISLHLRQPVVYTTSPWNLA